ncbi:580_t:CDS:2 [Entrophospora sp. SA101]|nr:580_t:CDS:2 [Entrophospora sp. SA101]
MSLLTHVIKALEKIAPLSLAHTKWDNVGLLVEPQYPRSSATSVFLTIDLTPIVLEEAIPTPSVGMIHKTANNSKQSEKSSIQEYSKVIAGVNAIRMNNKAVYTNVAGVRDILEKEHVSKDFDAYDDDTIYILESVCLQRRDEWVCCYNGTSDSEWTVDITILKNT